MWFPHKTEGLFLNTRFSKIKNAFLVLVASNDYEEFTFNRAGFSHTRQSF